MPAHRSRCNALDGPDRSRLERRRARVTDAKALRRPRRSRTVRAGAPAAFESLAYVAGVPCDMLASPQGFAPQSERASPPVGARRWRRLRREPRRPAIEPAAPVERTRSHFSRNPQSTAEELLSTEARTAKTREVDEMSRADPSENNDTIRGCRPDTRRRRARPTTAAKRCRRIRYRDFTGGAELRRHLDIEHGRVLVLQRL